MPEASARMPSWSQRWMFPGRRDARGRQRRGALLVEALEDRTVLSATNLPGVLQALPPVPRAPGLDHPPPPPAGLDHLPPPPGAKPAHRPPSPPGTDHPPPAPVRPEHPAPPPPRPHHPPAPPARSHQSPPGSKDPPPIPAQAVSLARTPAPVVDSIAQASSTSVVDSLNASTASVRVGAHTGQAGGTSEGESLLASPVAAADSSGDEAAWRRALRLLALPFVADLGGLARSFGNVGFTGLSGWSGSSAAFEPVAVGANLPPRFHVVSEIPLAKEAPSSPSIVSAQRTIAKSRSRRPRLLLADILPFDAGVLERGMEQFLQQVEGLASSVASDPDGFTVPPWLLAVTAAAVAGEFARRHKMMQRENPFSPDALNRIES